MVRNRKETTEKSKKKPGLSTQIFIALLAGALLGVVIHYWIPSSYIKDTVIVEGVLYVIGQGFIRLMQMLVVPLVFCSLVCGSMSIGDSKTLGKVGVKTIGFYLVTTALAVCIALGTALLIHPGLGLNMSAVQKADLSSTAADSSVSLVDTLLNIIPKNPIGSMANGDMLPIIVFALFVGVMLAKLGNRASVVSNFISQFNDVMMEMTMTVMKVAPVGVFCLIARTFATVGFSAFAPMLKYMGNVTLALALQCFVIYQVLLFVFCLHIFLIDRIWLHILIGNFIFGHFCQIAHLRNIQLALLGNIVNTTASVYFHLFFPDFHLILQKFSQCRRFQIFCIDKCLKTICSHTPQCQWTERTVLDPVHIRADDSITVFVSIDIIQTGKLADIKINNRKLIPVCILF